MEITSSTAEFGFRVSICKAMRGRADQALGIHDVGRADYS